MNTEKEADGQNNTKVRGSVSYPINHDICL